MVDKNGNGAISLQEFQQFVGDEKDVAKKKAKRETKKKTGN